MATTLPTFPASELDSAASLLSVAGGFWADVYRGNALVESLLFARGCLESQTHRDLLELAASMSRRKIPVHHTDLWCVLTLKESELNTFAADLAQFDGAYRFDEGLHFDTPVPGAMSVWQAPAGLSEVLVITNRITEASLTWVQGVDYFLKNGAIWFRENPFQSDLVLKRELFAGNALIDRECDLWLYRSQWDRQTLYQQFGYAVNLLLPSSANYKGLLNAVYNGFVGGSTVRAVQEVFMAACDVPMALTDETVERIVTDQHYLLVITDQHAYRFQIGSTLLVGAGDELKAGDPITDTVRFYDCNRGQLPDGIRALAVGRGFLATGYFQDLIFEDTEVVLTVDENDPSGYTRVSFEIGGNSADVEKFWGDVHAAGVAREETLAMLLDRRPQPASGQPTALALPTTVNPLEFLLQNVLRNNLFLVKLQTARFGPDALKLNLASVLRRLAPPHVACIMVIELTFGSDEVTMDGPGTSLRAGYEEEVNVFLGASITEEIDPATMTEEAVRCYPISGQYI